MKRFLVLALSVLGGFSFALSDSNYNYSRNVSNLKDGTYIGFIAMNEQSAKIPVVLEILKGVVEKKGLPPADYAILRTSFGGFDSHEYVVQQYIISSHKDFILDANYETNGPDTSFLEAEVTDGGEFIRAKVRTAFGGPIRGVAKLFYMPLADDVDKELDEMFPNRFIIPSVSGEYYGQCHGERKILQLDAIRRFNPGRTNTAFLGYIIHGRYGTAPTSRRVRYGHEENAPYVYRALFEDVTFNYYVQDVTIPMFRSHCKMTEKGLDCGQDCQLTKFHGANTVGDQLVNKKVAKHTPNPDLIPENTGTPFYPPYKRDQLSGDYLGYLHMESSDLYERMELSIAANVTSVTTDFAKAGYHYISANGNVFICASELIRSAHIPFRFQPKLLPSTDLSGFTMQTSDESVIRITNWSEAGISGIWYSRNYGRVGNFFLKKVDTHDGRLPDLEAKHAQLDGRYRRKLGPHVTETVNVVVTADTRGDSAPSFPFHIGGAIEFEDKLPATDNFTQRTFDPIKFGTYDAFTQKITLLFNTGRVFVGTVTAAGMEGYLSGATIGRRVWEQDSVFYKREPLN